MDNNNLQTIVEQLRCEHSGRTGGNDYIYCPGCGLQWDYRRETATQAIAARLEAEVERLTALLSQQEPEKDDLARRDTRDSSVVSSPPQRPTGEK